MLSVITNSSPPKGVIIIIIIRRYSRLSISVKLISLTPPLVNATLKTMMESVLIMFLILRQKQNTDKQTRWVGPIVATALPR